MLLFGEVGGGGVIQTIKEFFSSVSVLRGGGGVGRASIFEAVGAVACSGMFWTWFTFYGMF